jgi:hypothetical protein
VSLSSRTVVPIVFAAILGGVIALATARSRSGGAAATAEVALLGLGAHAETSALRTVNVDRFQ